MTAKEKLIKQLGLEVEKNIRVTMNNKRFLKENASLFPVALLKDLIKSIRRQNKAAKKYIEIAIDQNPNLVAEMKAKERGIRQKIRELREAEEKGALEEDIEKKLRSA